MSVNLSRRNALTVAALLAIYPMAIAIPPALAQGVAGLRVAELPVEWHDVAGSKIRLWPDAAHIARDILRLRRRLRRA